MRIEVFRFSSVLGAFVLSAAVSVAILDRGARSQATPNDPTATTAVQLVNQGKQIFRFDTFGDEAFWEEC